MSKGINKVILVGHLGADPEIRYTSSDKAMVNVNIATTETWKDRQTGERRDSTEWHRLVMFGRLAEIARDYTNKGSQIYVEGRLQTRKWQDRDGNDRYTTEVVVNDLALLGGRGTDSRPSEPSRSEPPDQRNRQQQNDGPGDNKQPKQNSSEPAGDEFDDDIPF